MLDYEAYIKLDNDIKHRPATFSGTTAEWEALSAAEKSYYEIVNISDDTTPDIVDPTPTSGSTNLVSSGGVFNALTDKEDAIQLGNYTAYISDDTGFVTAITNYIKNTFGNRVIRSASVRFTRGGIYAGQLVYDPDNNGYISILAHVYTSGGCYHFGISNGSPFYEILGGNAFKKLHSSRVLNPVFNNGYALIPWSSLDRFNYSSGEFLASIICSTKDDYIVVAGFSYNDDGIKIRTVKDNYSGTGDVQIYGLVVSAMF